MSRQPPRARRARLTASTADRHVLYQEAVQCPEADIRFLRRIYRARHGRLPLRLREDFCGTGLLACEWVRATPQARSVGVDLDAATLAWGRRHVRGPMGEAARRVELLRDDVRRCRRRADVVAALNFSYFCFKQRAELLGWLRGVRASLLPGGMLVLDVFGGTEAGAVQRESTRKRGFTYVWEQAGFDPVSSELLCHIHFRFPDGTWLRRAFTYDWRLWTIPEIRECLDEAGFAESEVHWQGTARDGSGNGVYRKVRRAETCEAFVSYVVAWR